MRRLGIALLLGRGVVHGQGVRVGHGPAVGLRVGQRGQRLVEVRALLLGLAVAAAHDGLHQVVVQAGADVAREEAELVGLLRLGVARVQVEVVLVVVVGLGLGVAREELVERRHARVAARQAVGAGGEGDGAGQGGQGDGAEADEALGDVHGDFKRVDLVQQL